MTATTPPAPDLSRNVAAAGGADTDATYLRRLRWAVRAVLTLGVTASIAANVLHARPNLVSQIIAAWPPLALLLTVELISRVPADRRWLANLRLLAAAVIAGIAAWVSYWHMAGVAARYGETDAGASHLLPLSVDGLVVVASISLVEIAGRIRTATMQPSPATMPAPSPPPDLPATDPVAASPPEAATASPSVPAVPAAPQPAAATVAVAVIDDSTADSGLGHAITAAHAAPGMMRDQPAQPAAGGVDDHHQTGRPDHALPDRTATPPEPGAGSATAPTTDDLKAADAEPPGVDRRPASADDIAQRPTALPGPNSDQPPNPAPSPDGSGDGEPNLDVDDDGRSGRNGHDAEAVVPSDTPAAVAYWHHRDPSLHPADIAAKIGRSERTVRRYWPPSRATNGHEASDLAEQLRAS
ncbi:DUF2637 domain-containing protein [Dactylosporangium sp. CA-092794]|uniref:DUF2637 domain-containing protein n=1 Tax=Dactylosporangium sp. CA-092794 TaxID=3239929 RepID=UPI003D92CE69